MQDNCRNTMVIHKLPNLMKKCLLLGVLMWGAFSYSNAQDVTQLLADTKSFTFDDNETTVKGYILAQLESNTACCGSDRIYLEVRIDPSGYVVDAKTLTGKNQCMKNSAMDIVKNIKWDAKDFKGTRPVYFEIRPNIDCDANRSNSYAQIPVTNNELLDQNGKKKDPKAGTEIVLNTETKVETTPAPAPTENNPATSETTTTSKEGENSETSTKTNAEETVAASESNTETPTNNTNNPSSEEENAETVVASNEESPQEESSSATSTTSTDNPDRVVRGAASDEVTSATPQETPEQKAEREAKEAEVKQLQNELAEFRKKEEELQAERLRRAEERRNRLDQRRRRQQEAQEAQQAQDEMGFFPASEEGTTSEGNQLPQGANDIQRLEGERNDMENRRRQLEDSRRRDAQEQETVLRDLLRVEEEIKRKEEEITRQKEQEELDRMVEDRSRMENDRVQIDQEMQRLVGEIQRLQAELNRKVGELDIQDQEIQRINANIMTREQEIAQSRSTREQTLEAELALKRRQTELTIAGLNSQPSPGAGTLDPAILAQADSSGNTTYLLQQIMLLQQELQRVKGTDQISGGITGLSPATEGAVSASQDQSWQNVNYNAPSGYTQTPSSGNTGATADPNYQGQGYKPVVGYSPAPAHQGTHANTSGPMFTLPQYGAGQSAMTRYITDRLKAAGVCGNAQAFAEVTVDPRGKVVDQKVLKANSTQVITLLPGVLRTLQFQPTLSRINQISYIEFKSNIRCGVGNSGGGVNGLATQPRGN